MSKHFFSRKKVGTERTTKKASTKTVMLDNQSGKIEMMMTVEKKEPFEKKLSAYKEELQKVMKVVHRKGKGRWDEFQKANREDGAVFA